MVTKFSIIIPVYNDAEDLQLVLDGIEKQNFPKENFEIFVVDNGSSDDSVEVAKSFSFVNVLLEHKNLGSPYSCRNRGIEKAKGDIIVLLDASCKPVKNWLRSAITCLEKTEADIIGGDVRFDFKEKVSAAKVYDSITNIRMQESIEEKGVAKTANLFIRKKVFKKVGFFPEALRSGGDVRWTSKAVEQGCKLKFCREAAVYKTARGFWQLLKKQWRVGIHQPLIKAEFGEKINLVKRLAIIFYPISMNSLRDKHQRNIKNHSHSLFKLWVIGQSVRMIMSTGNIWGAIRHRKEINNLLNKNS